MFGEYKCICCGQIKECKDSCVCSECGYKMFPMPFERKKILISEIILFIKSLIIDNIKDEYLSYYRLSSESDNRLQKKMSEYVTKEEDEARFPNFAKIQQYICHADKTEIFIERLNTSLDQIKKYISSPFRMEYFVDCNCLKQNIIDRELAMKQLLETIGVNADFDEPEFPEAKLDYGEVPDDTLVEMLNSLIESTQMFVSKIHAFIKQNNIYGIAYNKKFKSKIKTSGEKDIASLIRETEKKISIALNKKYIIDIFSDGEEELDEMLEMLWYAIKVVLNVQTLTPTYKYIYSDIECSKNEYYESILSIISKRYHFIEINNYYSDILNNKNESELFNIYNQVIELDYCEFMGVNKCNVSIPGEYERKLNSLIGLSDIKESIQKIKAYALSNKDSVDLNIHMCFLGNPGSGKTEVARYIAGILYENKILPTKKIIEVDRSGLVSEYFGATAEKTRQVIASAMGGVLFIDEAYALGNNSEQGGTDYGKEAIDTLVKAMEDYRGKFCVILAGYKNEMLQMLSMNPGFKSRIQFTLDFPNYSRDELRSITELMLKNRQYTIGKAAIDRILDITDVKRKEPNFANAREIRNILDQVIMCQNVRRVGTNDKELGIVDVNKYIQDAKINLPTTGDGLDKKILTGEEELDQLVGLSAIKRMIKKIKAYAKRNKGQADFNLHMCFYGNPGTGKTEVARILSRILYDAGVLDEAKLVETDGQGLIGKFVGETASKTETKINESMNGVLFIDEAYSLVGSTAAIDGAKGHGDEAITVLLKAMEDHRGRFCTILAGYKDEMKNMLRVNPGFESRIQFKLEFPDYSREELGQIAIKFLNKKKYIIDMPALDLLLDITDYYRNRDNFANARTVRNILDQVIMNQNLRTEDDENDDGTIIKSDVEDYLSDEGLNLNDKSGGTHQIGFV